MEWPRDKLVCVITCVMPAIKQQLPHQPEETCTLSRVLCDEHFLVKENIKAQRHLSANVTVTHTFYFINVALHVLTNWH